MRARAAASVALIFAAAAVLAGCSLVMEPETQQPYDPSDGVNADIGELQFRNVLVVSDDGELGNLVMTVVNTGERDLDVELQYETDGTKHDVEISVDGGTTTEFGQDEQLLLEDIGTRPGGLLDLYVQYGDVPGEQLSVPVLDGALPQYSDLVPVAPKPTPKPTATPSPTPTETPAP